MCFQRESFGLNQLDLKVSQYLNFSNGFFIEVGANDGVSQSNTLYLEKYRKWKGLLIEAIPELAQKCKINRPNCIVENYALVPFDYEGSDIEMHYCNLMSLVKGAQKSALEELDHIERGCKVQKISSYQISVPARTLNSILEEHNIEKIDFFSLDVEGYELSVLKGIDLERFQPTYILVEARYRQEIDDYLDPYYEVLAELTERDILYKSKRKIQEEQHFKLATPVVLFVSRQIDLTQQVFKAIAQAKPPKLFIVANEVSNSEEAKLYQEVQAVIQQVDWECEVFTHFATEHLELKKYVASSLDWVFSQVEEAIILEEGYLPVPSFFYFCQTLLERYRHDERVVHISGNNLQLGHQWTPYSYYFSHYTSTGGWATWRSAWRHFDIEMTTWSEVRDSKLLVNILENPYELDYWTDIFENIYRGKVDGWEHIWTYCCWMQNGLSILPESNLISNLNLQEDTVSTQLLNATVIGLPALDIWDIDHPPFIVKHRGADAFTFDYLLGGKEMKEFVKQLQEQLAQSQEQLTQTKRQLIQTQEQLAQTKEKLEHSHKLLKESRQKVKQLRIKFKQFRQEMTKKIVAMESSKLWKLRNIGIKIKKLLRL